MKLANRINSSSVFLVSGGARGVTSECVIRLAQQYQCKFILLGRSPIIEFEPDYVQNYFDESGLKKSIMEYQLSQAQKPTPISVQKIFNQISASREIKNTLSRVQQAGGSAEYFNIDITDYVSLYAKVTHFSAITGIIHGAGNLADKLIEKKTEQDFEIVYAAKVQGLENLLSCVNISQLQHLILFSSTSGFYGNVGQTDYAMANEILNKSAHLIQQKYPNCHVVAINWGPWENGMVTPELKKAFTERNIGIIPIEIGTQMLVKELNSGNQVTPQVLIASPITPPATKLNSELKTYHIHRQLILEENPFLQDHVIAGKPVLPTTCAVSWIINTCENLYPGYRLFNCTNFKVLKGIIFDENFVEEYILEIQERVKNNNSQEIEVFAKISSGKSHKIRYHFSGDFKLLREIPPAPFNGFPETQENTIPYWEDNNFYQSWVGMLFHGPSFQGIKNFITFSREKFTAKCFWQKIEAKQQGQFPVQWFNPYALDISTHPLGIWLQHFYQESVLPASLEKYEQFATIPYNEEFYISGEIKSKTDFNLVADFVIFNSQGKVSARLFGVTFIRWFMTYANKSQSEAS
ncbi:KR domain-containing protein [Nostoc sp. KVJ3]|uniref:KR domain-containing protein n=1 Tax=Nostoc sp. KVJ3 TaxID=457945 RepID=UPI0022387D25|nr:KR domain-containing protein [Nostoc sp. KVJ3]MCW5319209.1 KR domain-containing protein [Nostoc sp. KVJ3]